jgi:hypothetical protein
MAGMTSAGHADAEPETQESAAEETARLRAELGRMRAQLAAARAEAERLMEVGNEARAARDRCVPVGRRALRGGVELGGGLAANGGTHCVQPARVAPRLTPGRSLPAGMPCSWRR